MVNPISKIQFEVYGKENDQREHNIRFLCRAEKPIEGDDGNKDFPDDDILDIELGAWKMYFDEATNQYGNGIEVLLITPDGSHVPLAVKLNFKVTNNMAEYEACIVGMEALRDLGLKEAKVFGI